VASAENKSPSPDTKTYCSHAGNREQDRLLTEDGVDKASADRIEHRLRSAFPEGALTRVQVLQYGDDPEVEPGQTVIRVFFDWPGRSKGEQSNPKTVHAFLTSNAAGLDMLRNELPGVVEWVEFSPESADGRGRADGLSYRIAGRGRRAAATDDVRKDLTPVMTRLEATDLATLDTLITAGMANNRADAIRWALSHIREHPAYAQLRQPGHQTDERKAQV
jgi:hypothetical protein